MGGVYQACKNFAKNKKLFVRAPQTVCPLAMALGGRVKKLPVFSCQAVDIVDNPQSVNSLRAPNNRPWIFCF